MDKESVLVAVKKGEMDIPIEFCDDKEIALESVRNWGMSIAYLSGRLKKDKEIVLESLKTNPNGIFYLHSDLLHDYEFIKELYDKNFIRYGDYENMLYNSAYNDVLNGRISVKSFIDNHILNKE